METCETCKFFLGASGPEGLCQRYPPTVDARWNVIRPIVQKREWCGEYKAKETRE